MKRKLETRIYPVDLETRAEGGEGIVTGRPIVYNSIADLGDFTEEIAFGALDGANLEDVRFCLNHDTSFVYARSRRNNPNSTMQLFPDAQGMTFAAKLAIEQSAAHMDYFTMLSREDVDKMSFMFSVADDEWTNLDSDKPHRIIRKIAAVIEISGVTFPAYNQTSISTRSAEALENALSSLENARQLRAATLEKVEIEKLKLQIQILGG